MYDNSSIIFWHVYLFSSLCGFCGVCPYVCFFLIYDWYCFFKVTYLHCCLTLGCCFDLNWSLVSIQNKWFSTTILPHYALRVSSPPPYINEELFCSKLQCPSEFQRLRISSACWAPLILASFPSLTVEIKWEWRVFEHKKAAFSSPMPWSWFR